MSEFSGAALNSICSFCCRRPSTCKSVLVQWEYWAELYAISGKYLHKICKIAAESNFIMSIFFCCCSCFRFIMFWLNILGVLARSNVWALNFLSCSFFGMFWFSKFPSILEFVHNLIQIDGVRTSDLQCFKDTNIWVKYFVELKSCINIDWFFISSSFVFDSRFLYFILFCFARARRIRMLPWAFCLPYQFCLL